jgi:hypothetical protein
VQEGDVVGLAIAALACVVVSFGLLFWAAARHEQHASWPTKAIASKNCRYLLFFSYAIVATTAAEGITSWSIAAQSQVFFAVYLAGGFAITMVVGTWIADRIGRSIMALRFNKDISRYPAVSVLPDSAPVRLIFADGHNEEVSETKFKDKRQIRFFETIVTAAWQRAQQRILLVTESGDIFTSRIEEGKSAEDTSTSSRPAGAEPGIGGRAH